MENNRKGFNDDSGRRVSREKLTPKIEKQCSQKWPIARNRKTCDAMETYEATKADARKE